MSRTRDTKSSSCWTGQKPTAELNQVYLMKIWEKVVIQAF